MPKTLQELTVALDKLEAALAGMIELYPAADLMDVVKLEVEVIGHDIADGNREYFHTRVQCMLRDAGLIPGDEEPCDIED